jgi:hypothetical protein
MKIFTSSFIILFLFVFVFGQDHTTKLLIATTEDGRKVILKADKTWEYEIESSKNELNQVIQKSQTIKTLQMPFIGNNLAEVTDFIDSIKDKIEKSEFETEAQYRNRIKKLVAETKFENKLLNEIVFVTTPKFYFNAEKQTFNISFSDLKFEIESKTVRQSKFKDYSLQISKRRALFDNFDYTAFFPEIIFNMSPQRAKEVKQNLRVAIYGSPVKVHGYINAALYFVPMKYIVFNSITGEIYSEIIEKDLINVK